MDQQEKRVSEFVSSCRLGIDLGEKNVGLALVRGKEILDAKVFLDKHKSTLEERRKNRRGRRTRHARKMRLARLRSWILRQKLLDGTRLPDPYKILRNPEFQTKPGVYRNSTQNPQNAPSWVEKAKCGETDVNGFVMAVAQIFQKRGYKYKDTELSEMKDPELLEFLKSCSGLKKCPDLMGRLQNEIGRRMESKNHRKLLDAFQSALEQEIAPKKAAPRQFKEEELIQIVDAFGKKHGFPEDTIDTWKTQLVNLLNKFVKIAKFDNRIISGCSWCGKSTPRISKPEVRRLAYRAAIRNVRIMKNEFSRYPTEKLESAEIIKLLEGWWDLKQQVDSGKAKYDTSRKSAITRRAPTKLNIEKFLETIGAFEYDYEDGKKVKKFKMATQLFNGV